MKSISNSHSAQSVSHGQRNKGGNKQLNQVLFNGGFRATPPLPGEEWHCHSWRSAILPRLERKDSFQSLDWSLAASSPENQGAFIADVGVFICPSTNTRTEYPGLGLWKDRNGVFSQEFGNAARTDYEAIAGMVPPNGSGRSHWHTADFGTWGDPKYTYANARPLKYSTR
jgi:hypothetical protein